MTTEDIWEEIRANCRMFIFPDDRQTVVPFAMAKLVAYAKYGPAVLDHCGVLRLRGSQRLLMHHEEAALFNEEIRAIVVDIFMLRSNKANGGKRTKMAGGNDKCGSPRRVSARALASSNVAKPPQIESDSNVRDDFSNSGIVYKSASGTAKKNKLDPTELIGYQNEIISPTMGKNNGSQQPPLNSAFADRPSASKSVVAPNIAAMALPDEVFGIEMLDQQHPMASQVLELSRVELDQLCDHVAQTLPTCEKDGSKVKRSTIADHFADIVFAERDRRVFCLKRSDAKLDDVRTDPTLTKRREISIYNKTAPLAYTITTYDQPHHVQRALHRRAFQVANLADGNNPNIAANVRCVRDEYRIEPGTVKEGWDGYCCIRESRYGGGPVHKHTTSGDM